MKAIVYHQYGSPDVLQLEEVEKPIPKENEVLVKVQTASINSWDWDLVTGKPLIYRLLFGLQKPKYPIIGCDIAGMVEAIGRNVTRFQPGDEVFGDVSGFHKGAFGAFAEYACASENMLALKPSKMSFEEAAAIPQAGVLALQGLRQGKIQEGQRVLINGAGGGVGTFAIQLAKLWGAEVTAVDSSDKLNLMQSLGADHVIDYTKEDFTKIGQQYDLILDVVARHSVWEFRRALHPNGIAVIVGGLLSSIFQTQLFGSWGSSKKISLLLHKPNNKDSEYLADLVESGKLKPVIDKCYRLSETADAIRHLGEGRVKGKIVITTFTP